MKTNTAVRNTQTAAPRLTLRLDITPHKPVEFRGLFDLAKTKWPTICLGYVGTNRETGGHYMQQNGNPNPFIISADELADWVRSSQKPHWDSTGWSSSDLGAIGNISGDLMNFAAILDPRFDEACTLRDVLGMAERIENAARRLREIHANYV